MANAVSTTVEIDGDRNVVVKVVGVLDSSDLSATAITAISSLVPAPGKIRVDKIQYSASENLDLCLWWDATADTTPVVCLTGRGEMCFKDFGGLVNPKETGWTGNILLTTTGWTSGTKHFTLVLSLVKQDA